MANESFAQGLLQNLLSQQQPQGLSSQDIMAAMSSRSPMAAVMAASVPQTTQAIGAGVRGMMGGITGQKPLTASEAYNKAMQQLTQQEGFGTTSASLTAMAQAASAVGRTQEAMQLMAQANEMKKAEQTAIQQQAQAKGARDANIRAVAAARQSIDAARYPGLATALDGLSSQYFAETEPSSPDKVQSTISNMFERAKVELPKAPELTPNQIAELYKDYTSDSINAFLSSGFSSPLIPLKGEESGFTPSQLANLYKDFTAESIQQHLSNPKSPLIPIAQANERRLTLAEEANLYKSFTVPSIESFIAGKGPLVPLGEGETGKMTLAQQADLASKFTSDSIRAWLKSPDTANLVPLDKQTVPSSVLEYNWAVENGGYQGTFEDWKNLGAARSTTVGAAPSGYYYTSTPNGELQLKPIPGGPADKGLNISEAGRVALITTAMSNMNEIRDLVLEKDAEGNVIGVNKTIIAQANVPLGGWPFSQGRTLNILIKDALEGKIRVESGAAVPDTEITRLSERFRPSVLDSDETAIRKIQLLQNFFDHTMYYLKPDGTFDTDTAIADINSKLASGEDFSGLGSKTDDELLAMLRGEAPN